MVPGVKRIYAPAVITQWQPLGEYFLLTTVIRRDRIFLVVSFRKGGGDMCQSCGCSPCKVCGRDIKNGVCSGCGKKSSECKCK